MAVGCPAIVRGDIDVTGANARPVAGAPDVAIAGPHPVARDMEHILARRLAGSGNVRRRGGLGVVRDPLPLLVLRLRPEATDPLPVRADFAPVSGNPFLPL